MIAGIVAGGVSAAPPPGPGGDPHWDDVMLLVDASTKSTAIDTHWDDVILLIDNSKAIP